MDIVIESKGGVVDEATVLIKQECGTMLTDLNLADGVLDIGKVELQTDYGEQLSVMMNCTREREDCFPVE